MDAASPPKPFARWRIGAAWTIAVLADLLQIGVFPVFGEGFSSPADDVMDLVVGAALTGLIGFHWSYLPTLVIELVPFADAAPAWTGAVFLATRAKHLSLR
jgi:hypothetical protein